MTVVKARKRGVESVRLCCDGGTLAPEDCRVFAVSRPDHWNEPLPDGWAWVRDPFGRVGEDGSVMILHLCDRCMSHVPETPGEPVSEEG